jgi:hypothetical protein
MAFNRGDYKVAASFDNNSIEGSKGLVELTEYEIAMVIRLLNQRGEVENTADGTKGSTIFTVVFSSQDAAKDVCRTIANNYDFSANHQLNAKRNGPVGSKQFVYYIIVKKKDSPFSLSGAVSSLAKSASGLLTIKSSPPSDDEDDENDKSVRPQKDTVEPPLPPPSPSCPSIVSTMSVGSKIINALGCLVKITLGGALLYFLIMVLYFLYVNDHECVHGK